MQKKWRKDWNKKLKAKMAINGITATEIAEHLEVSVQYVSSALTGSRKSVSDGKKQEISEAFEKIAAAK